MNCGIRIHRPVWFWTSSSSSLSPSSIVSAVEEFRGALGDKADSFVEASKTEDKPKHREAMKEAFKTLLEKDEAEIKSLLKTLVDKTKSKSEFF